ncbi:MAG: VapC toxin family PIN domain ribonuclease [Cyanobacteriota bacterium]|jgi:hypothetical protein
MRRGLPRLAALLQDGEVLNLWQGLPAAMVATDAEVLLLIERNQLMGRGISDGDAHLLASAKLSRCAPWSQDRCRAALARDQGLGLATQEEPSAKCMPQRTGPL